MLNRTALLQLTTLLIVSTLAAPMAASPGPASRLSRDEPRITFLDQPTPEERDIIVWAVDRFRSGDLHLPDLDVSFPAHCAGKAALYHVGRSTIEFCHINRRVVLHEFAHAWDDTSGAVDRAAFLEMRGLSVWFGGTKVPWREQGSEHLAHIIAWGLMDVETRSAHGLPANAVSELTAAFEMLTRG